MPFYVIVSLALMVIATVNSCNFGNDTIQSMYDRFEVFRKTKAFDPTDETVPLTHYSYHETDGPKRLAIKIGGDYMVEHLNYNDANEIETDSGQYHVKDGVILNYKRDENGEFSFEDWSNGKKFASTLRSFDTELPNNLEEDYKNVLYDLNTMRQKMFDYQNGLSTDDFSGVQLFDFTPLSSGGFYAQYSENEGSSLSVSAATKDGKETISGGISCGDMYTRYTTLSMEQLLLRVNLSSQLPSL